MPWASLCLQGRHKGIALIGTSQRPAHIDKDFLGGATLIHTGMLGYDEDIGAVARAMRVEPARIAELKPLEWLERDRATGKVTRGAVEFSR